MTGGYFGQKEISALSGAQSQFPQQKANRKFKDITRNRSDLNFGVFPLKFAQRRPQSEGGGYKGGSGTMGAALGWRAGPFRGSERDLPWDLSPHLYKMFNMGPSDPRGKYLGRNHPP
ncbi:unnamed protein product [Leptosia nina]|uniref:Uncharacterized protein n=1 Tax=Leptosia nina TaxID=320188 RepID=A0AAV1J5P3_9NEOP